MSLSQFFSTTFTKYALKIASVSSNYAYLPENGLELAISNETFELEARVRIDINSGDYGAIFGRYFNGNAEYSMFYNSNQRNFAFDSFTQNSTGALIYEIIPFNVVQGVFYKVKITYNGSQIKGYIDDVLYYTHNITFTINPSNGVQTSFMIGRGGIAQYYPDATIEYIKVTRAGIPIVHLNFNSGTGVYRNLVGNTNQTLVLYNNTGSVAI